MGTLTPPPRSAFSENDWRLLASFWHPVAFSSDVGAEPKTTTLLDLDLMIVRTREGVVVVHDRCPHRGARISLGRILPDRFVCGYHGIEFGLDGKAIGVPTAPDNYRIPSRLCLDTFMVEEKYGLVWTCLSGKPRVPLPEWSVFDDTSRQKAKLDVAINTGAGRHIENFCDTAHFPFIHDGTFGCLDRPVVPDYDVVEREAGLHARIDTVQQDGSLFLGDPVYADVPSEYDITFPYAAMLLLHFPRGDEHIFDVVSPVSADRCHVFMWKIRDHDLDEPTDEWVGFQAEVNEEDRAMVESEHPLELPIDPRMEVHLPSDKLSLTYRKKWRAFGLEGPRR